jgi:hypothetical protein
MVWCEIRRARRAGLVLALVAWLPAIASSEQEPTAADQREIIAERIEEARAQGGAYSKELIDPLTSLAELYQESGNHDLATAGEHIDVAFDITRYGFADRVEVLSKTASVSDESEEALVRLIEQWRFRPRVVDGTFPRSSRVEVRYYLND